MSTARVAVVGTGIAASACARRLAEAGFGVQLFDKARGVGGRLATRRAEWTDADGTVHPVRFDHGAPGFSARSPEFVRFVEQSQRDGLLSRWVPRLAPASYAPLDEAALWVPTPDMPALCRALLDGLPVRTGTAVDRLVHDGAGWRVDGGGDVLGEGFDAAIVATPPRQAAPLLMPHRGDWADQAQRWPMRAGWTLMAVTDGPDGLPDWDMAWPANDDVIAQVLRNDAKPGREAAPPGQAHWVVHAASGWSATHLEAPAEPVQAALQAALERGLGRPLRWHHAAVHRWRYASVPRAAATAGRCWWDAALGLGACGDALGGAGVEGAWLSGVALAAHLIDRMRGSQARGHVVSPSLAPTPRNR